MTKKTWSGALVLLIFFSTSAFGQLTNDSKAGFGLTYNPITVKTVAPFVYCCLPHKGPLTDIESVIAQLMETMQNQKITPMGALFGVYYNSPEEAKPEELQWEFAFPVSPQASPQKPLEKKTWTYRTVATGLHVGPYEKVGKTIGSMEKQLEAEGYSAVGPILERYLDMDPSKVKPEQLRTEIWIPCEKRKKQ